MSKERPLRLYWSQEHGFYSLKAGKKMKIVVGGTKADQQRIFKELQNRFVKEGKNRGPMPVYKRTGARQRIPGIGLKYQTQMIKKMPIRQRLIDGQVELVRKELTKREEKLRKAREDINYDLKQLTLDELKVIAREAKIKNYSDMRKQELALQLEQERKNENSPIRVRVRDDTGFRIEESADDLPENLTPLRSPREPPNTPSPSPDVIVNLPVLDPVNSTDSQQRLTFRSKKPSSELSGKGRVLKLQALFEDQISEYLDMYNCFAGVVARDEIKNIRKVLPCGFVINTSERGDVGKHWVACYIDPCESMSLEYFDSLGDPCPLDILEDILYLVKHFGIESLLKFKQNNIRFQKETSETCGYMAIHFLQQRFEGIPFITASKFDRSASHEELMKSSFDLI